MLTSFLNNIIDKFFVKQWSIGLAYCNMDKFLNNKNDDISFTWLKNEKHEFNADPFLFYDKSKNIYLLYENFNYKRQYGIIKLDSINSFFKKEFSSVFFDNGYHCSYPNYLFHNDKFYFYPECSKSGKISIYQIDLLSQKTIKSKVLLNVPLLDPTILYYEKKYWLFGTIRGKQSNSDLYIFHSGNLLGPYLPHAKNPVKSSLKNSRPAGNFFFYNNLLLRPSQNCSNSYGEELVINKVNILNEDVYSEEIFTSIKLPVNSPYKHGIHTVNFLDNVIVIDGLRKIFNPILQLKYFFYKMNF